MNIRIIKSRNGDVAQSRVSSWVTESLALKKQSLSASTFMFSEICEAKCAPLCTRDSDILMKKFNGSDITVLQTLLPSSKF